MHEAPRRTGLVFPLLEHRQFVLHRAAAQLADPQADLDPIREGDGSKVITGRTHHETHHLAIVDVQATDFDQVGVHRRVEEAVVGHVVHMTVDIIVVPPGDDRLEVTVVGALWHAVGHRDFSRKGLPV
ncbi:hypothetical protein D3C84_500980 [compost metagenome]